MLVQNCLQARATKLTREQWQNWLGWHATGRRLLELPDRLYNAVHNIYVNSVFNGSLYLEFCIVSLAKADDKEVLPVADLNACSLDSSNQTFIGGTAQQLVWDPHGKYVVITFKSTNSIAIFRTYIQKYDLQISGGYYLNGQSPSEYPSFISFQPLNKDNDRSVLTIGWSTGRIQFYGLD